LVVAGLLMARPAAGQTPSFSPAQGQTFHVDLDTPFGSSSQFSHGDLAALTALHATATIARIGPDRFGAGAPSFTFMLQGGSAKDPMSARSDSAVELRMTPAANSVDRLVVEVYHWPSAADRLAGKRVETKTFSKTVALDETVEIWMAWASGVATVRVGAETWEAKIPFTVATVAMASSDGDLVVDPLVFGARK
jgi:hypothetical protein